MYFYVQHLVNSATSPIYNGATVKHLKTASNLGAHNICELDQAQSPSNITTFVHFPQMIHCVSVRLDLSDIAIFLLHAGVCADISDEVEPCMPGCQQESPGSQQERGGCGPMTSES